MTMKKLTATLLVVFIACTSNAFAANQNPKADKPKTFNFIFRYGPGRANELNTFKQTYTKDLIMDGTVTTKLRLSDSELWAIYQKIIDLNLFDGKIDPVDKRIILIPSSDYYLKVQIDSEQKELSWTNKHGKINDRLQQFTDYVISIIQSKDEYKRLPAAKGGYM